MNEIDWRRYWQTVIALWQKICMPIHAWCFRVSITVRLPATTTESSDLEWMATVPSALTRVFQTRGRHCAKVLRADANTRLQLHSFVYALVVTVIMFKWSYCMIPGVLGGFQSIIRFYHFMRIDRPNCRHWLREHLLQIHFAILQLWGTGFCRWVGKQVSNPAILNKSPINSKCTLWESSWVASSETVHWELPWKETRAREKWIQTRQCSCDGWIIW